MMCTMIGGVEAPYLAEWITYHALIGVTKFVLFEMNGSDAMREALWPFVRSGLVVLLPEGAFLPEVPLDPAKGENPSKKSIFHGFVISQCHDIAKEHARWLLVIDPDEFVVGEEPERFASWLTQLEASNDVGAVTLFRTAFGANGHKTRPEGLFALEAYTQPGYAETAFPKLVTFTDAVHLRRNHQTSFNDPRFRCLSVDGRLVASCADPGAYVKQSTSGYYLAHFLSRSYQECLSRNSWGLISRWRVEQFGSGNKSFAESFCQAYFSSTKKSSQRQLITPQLAQRVREEVQVISKLATKTIENAQA